MYVYIYIYMYTYIYIIITMIMMIIIISYSIISYYLLPTSGAFHTESQKIDRETRKVF